MKPVVFYCYDAYCGWCYGFSSVITQLAVDYQSVLDFDVLSGGMIFEEQPRHFSAIAPYIQTAYKNVEQTTGITFGPDFLWHVFNPTESDWHPESTMPAIALCIFKEYFPERAVQMASDIQVALNFEGRDLTDKEAYRHLVIRYGIAEEDFYAKLASEEYREQAYYEFALVKQLKVTGFPCLLMQVSESKFYLLSSGYADYETVKSRLDALLLEIGEVV